MPREGSFALAFFGRTRKVQEPAFSLSAGRKSFALKPIEVLVICLVIGRIALLDAARLAHSTMLDSMPRAVSARNDKAQSRVVANMLISFRNGAVGFIGSLDV